MLLVLQAFAAGCSALTGVEAIANSVPLFRRPQVTRARQTELILGLSLIHIYRPGRGTDGPPRPAAVAVPGRRIRPPVEFFHEDVTRLRRWSLPCGTTLSAMGVPAVRQQLSVLTHLGHSLPGVNSPQKAAGEVVRTLIRLGVAVSVSTVAADQAVLVAARAPRGAGTCLLYTSRCV